MDFKLEISTDNLNFQSLDLFPDQQLEYDLDFYDNLDIDSVKIPFFTTMKLPLTELNQSANRFNYNPLTSDKDDFPKEDYYFKLTTFGATNTVIRGILNVTSIEYNSDEPYIDIKLLDFINKYINDLKDVTLSELYDSTNPNYQTYYRANTDFTRFQSTVDNGGEAGIEETNPSYTRPIIFPYIDFCNDKELFGYGARQFTEYGAGMDSVGLVPVFSVKLFLEYLGRYLTDEGFETRVDSKLFGLNLTEAIPDFESEKLHMLMPCKLEANQATNTRTFTMRQAPYWTGTNEDMFTDFYRDNSTLSKIFATKYFFGAETFGNEGFAGENNPTSSFSIYGQDIQKHYYPIDDIFGNERGYFAPHMSFNGEIKFQNGTLLTTLESLKYEIPVHSDDKMIHGISPSESTMKFNMFIGIFEDGIQVKKIRLLDANGSPVEINASDATAVQGESEKLAHNSSSSHDYFSDVAESRYVILDPNVFTSFTDTLQWSEVPELYLPSGEEIEINGESRYGVNYFLEPISGTLRVSNNSGYHDSGSNERHLTGTALNDITEEQIRKAITSASQEDNLNITITANKPFNPYFTGDQYNIKNSLANTATLKPFDILLAICKRFNCGMYYEYDDVNTINVLRIDPLKYARSGTQNINQYIDDLTSAKVYIGGDKIKNITLNNQNYNLYYDDEDGDDITIGSTTQEINAEGVSDLKIDLKSSVYYKSVAGSALGFQTNQNIINGSITQKQVAFTKNIFTKHQDIGLRFAYVDKPLFQTRMKRPHTFSKYINQNMYTETQRTYENWFKMFFNGRLFNKNTQNWDLLAEDADGNTTDYYSFYVDDEKIKYSDSPSIEFDMVIPTSQLENLDFLLKDFTATIITQDTIAVKSVEGDVYEDNAYLRVKGILK